MRRNQASMLDLPIDLMERIAIFNPRDRVALMLANQQLHAALDVVPGVLVSIQLGRPTEAASRLRRYGQDITQTVQIYKELEQVCMLLSLDDEAHHRHFVDVVIDIIGSTDIPSHRSAYRHLVIEHIRSAHLPSEEVRLAMWLNIERTWEQHSFTDRYDRKVILDDLKMHFPQTFDELHPWEW